MKPLFSLITDTHIDLASLDIQKSIFEQFLSLNKELDIKLAFHGGDVFDERRNHSLQPLLFFRKVLDDFEESEIRFVVIPGNHDKPNYEEEDAWAGLFRNRLNKLDPNPIPNIVEGYKPYPLHSSKVIVHLIPFFDEGTTYPKYLDQAIQSVKLNPTYKHILITHCAIESVKNNDGSNPEKAVSLKSFDIFDLVLVGHYHNRQKIGSKIHYVGASHQHNFGEDERKGFVVINEDLSIEYYPSTYPRYITKEFNLASPGAWSSIESELIQKGEPGDQLRFVLKGSPEQCKSVDKRLFQKQGIKVEVKQGEVGVDTSYVGIEEFKAFDKKSILEEWVTFSLIKQVPVGKLIEGQEILNRTL